MRSLSILVPAAFRDAANLLSCALGYDTNPGSTYSVKLSSTGSGEPTHYGAHTWATDAFVDLLTSALAGNAPPVDGIDPATVSAVVGSLQFEVGDDPQTTWPALLQRTGLSQYSEND